jgi:ketosteroid isomerase-like protein
MVAMQGDDLGALGAAAYAAYVNRDESAVREVVSENVVWHALEGGGSFRDYNGIDEVLRYVNQATRMAAIEGTFEVEIGEVFQHGNYGVGLHTATSEGKSGTVVDREVLVGRAEGGKIVEVWQFFEDPAATRELYGG